MTEVRAEMAGVVLRIRAGVGERVEAGDELLALESMKMEIPVTAPRAGTVAEVRAGEGAFVQEGDVLVVLA